MRIKRVKKRRQGLFRLCQGGVLCVCAHVYSTFVCVPQPRTQGVLQTCSLGKLGPCWEHTQQDSTTNWLLKYVGTAGLISWQTVGSRGSEGGNSISLSLSNSHTHTLSHKHIPSNPTSTSFCTPLVACQIIAKTGKHDLFLR